MNDMTRSPRFAPTGRISTRCARSPRWPSISPGRAARAHPKWRSAEPRASTSTSDSGRSRPSSTRETTVSASPCTSGTARDRRAARTSGRPRCARRWRAACRIARHTAQDEFAGLADPDRMAIDPPDLDLFHPWAITAEEAIRAGTRDGNRGTRPRPAHYQLGRCIRLQARRRLRLWQLPRVPGGLFEQPQQPELRRHRRGFLRDATRLLVLVGPETPPHSNPHRRLA